MLNKVALLWRRAAVGDIAGPSRPSGPIDLANAARDRANLTRETEAFRKAALLYEKALARNPQDAPNQIQCGHMFKEGGMLDEAEAHYDLAVALAPDDADLALQMGHFYKTAGRFEESEKAYLRAEELAPQWLEPRVELERLYRLGYRGGTAARRAADQFPVTVGQPRGGETSGFDEQVTSAGLLGALEGLAPEIAPRHPFEIYRSHQESIELRRFGRLERSRWGMTTTLRGVEALRGFCISATPIVEVRLEVDGHPFYIGGPLRGFPIKDEKDNIYLRKYVFNIWYDFDRLREGRYDVQLVFIDAARNRRCHRETVMVAARLLRERHPESDGIVSVAPDDPRTLEDQINSQPSRIRPAHRSLVAKPRNVLVLRIDQLGDMVCSVPAMRRLREILPDARLVGLISPANVELAVSLSLFDDVIAAHIPDDDVEKRRVLTLADQLELRRKLEPYRFDMAIDLSHVNMSQPLMFLSDAPFLYGFNPRENIWLSAGIDSVFTHDFANGLECVPHTTKVMALIESLGVLMKSHARVERRADLPRSMLEPFGIAEADRFVVFHTGARIGFSRWPYYNELSVKVLENAGLKVVMVTDDFAMRNTLPSELTANTRFRLVNRRISFDELDALVSYCSALVANDSGPKHLASLRGANVVSIHSSRINWNEWGQEGAGSIISRGVPCAGCRIHHDPEECGQDFVCVKNITVDEVYDTIARYL